MASRRALTIKMLLRRFDAANARVDDDVAAAENMVREEALTSGHDGSEADAAVEKACLRGPQSSPRGTEMQILFKAYSLREIFAVSRASIEDVRDKVVTPLMEYGIEDEEDGAGPLLEGRRECDGPGERVLRARSGSPSPDHAESDPLPLSPSSVLQPARSLQRKRMMW